MSAKGTMLRRSLAALFVLWALPPMATAADPPLFASDEVMELALTIDFDDLCRPRESDECDFEATTMEYKDASGDWRSLPIEVQIRGAGFDQTFTLGGLGGGEQQADRSALHYCPFLLLIEGSIQRGCRATISSLVH